MALRSLPNGGYRSQPMRAGPATSVYHPLALAPSGARRSGPEPRPTKGMRFMSATIGDNLPRLAPGDWFIEKVAARSRPAVQAIRRHRVFRALRQLWIISERERFPRILAVAVGVFLTGGIVTYVLEQGGEEPLITSVWEGLWYSIVTMASVGYGDYTPKTGPGRVFGGLLILVGVILFSYVSAAIASIPVAQRIREGRGLEAVKFKGHILVCGWNAHAERVLERIALAQGSQKTQIVLINQLQEDIATEILLRWDALDIRYVRGDAGSEAVLERANAREARSAIVLADISHPGALASDERTTLLILASANTWCQDFHPTGFVPCTAHTWS